MTSDQIAALIASQNRLAEAIAQQTVAIGSLANAVGQLIEAGMDDHDDAGDAGHGVMLMNGTLAS